MTDLTSAPVASTAPGTPRPPLPGHDPVSEGGQALLGAGRCLGEAMSALWDSPLLAAGSAFASVLVARWAVRLVRRWRDWQHGRRLRGAKEILLLAPAEVDPDGVNLWWAQIAGLLRRRGWRRW